MRADNCCHINHQDIARNRLAGFLHEFAQEILRAPFRAGMQDRQSFQLPTLQKEFQHPFTGLMGRPYRANGFDFPIGQLDQGLDS
jgi:hypothetical protein